MAFIRIIKAIFPLYVIVHSHKGFSMRDWYYRLNRPTKLAVWITLGITVWMATGLLLPASEAIHDADTSRDTRDVSGIIAIQHSQAQPHQRTMTLKGVTEANRTAGLKAQTSGPIANLPMKEGSRLKKGDILVEIDPQNLPQQLRMVEALVKQREMEYKASQNLSKQGFTTAVRFAETLTQLEEARRQLKQAQIDLKNTAIRAPFNGVLEKLNAEVGDFVGVGVFGGEGSIAQVVDPDPLVITSSIPQVNLASITREGDVKVLIANKAPLHGKIRYIATVADASSRSFRVEVELPNPDYSVPAGLTAELKLPLETLQAHRIASSLLSLDDQGGVGVKTVDDQGVVHFNSIQVLDEDAQGLWVSGLPEDVWLVTKGQAFINDGQTIMLDKVKRESTASDAATDPQPVSKGNP